MDLRKEEIEIYFCTDSDEAILLVQTNPNPKTGDPEPALICRIGADGPEKERLEVPALAASPAVRKKRFCPLPLAMLPVVVSQAGVMADQRPEFSLTAHIRLGISSTITEVTIGVAFSLLAIVLLWRHRKRRMDRDFWIWAGVMAVFGIAGHVGYRVYRPSPK